EAATEFVRLGSHRYRIDVRDAGNYTRLLESVAADGLQVRRIVHLWTYEQYAGEVASLDALKRAQDRGVYSLLFLLQALSRMRDMATSGPSSLTLMVVSSHTQHVSPSDQTAPERSPVLGLIRTIPHEIPWLECRHIDLGAATNSQNAALVRRELSV